METIAPRKRRDKRSNANVGLKPSERKLDLLDLLDPFWNFKYLSSDWLHHFHGGNENAFQHALRLYFDQGLLDRPSQQRASPNANYKRIVYERSAQGARLVRAKRLIETPSAPHRSNSYLHELLIDLGFYAPMRFAIAGDPKLRLISARAILSNTRVPEATRTSDDPFCIRLRGAETMRFDGVPFGVERELANGKKAIIFFPGIEADRATEHIRSTDVTRSALGKHIRQIQEFFDRRLYLSHFGFPNSLVPIVTTNATHMKNAMAFVEREIGPCRYLLFKTLPDIGLQEHFPKPAGDFFSSPWLRVGHAPFAFDDANFQ